MRLVRYLVAFLYCQALSCCVAAAEPYPFSFETVTVADGIYAFVEPPGAAVVSGNTTVVVGDDGVLVVDTGHHPDLTRRMIAEIRRLTAQPVKYVVNTHWHNDHVAGNSIYAEAFPDARFIAHSFTARALETEVRPYYGAACEKLYRAQSAQLREAARTGLGANGKPLTDERRARLATVLRDADVAIAECGAFRFRGSDLAFDDRLGVRLGKRAVEVFWLGRANTAGDALVYVPDAKVLAVGDIVVHPFPFATQSYIGEWVAVLRKVQAMDTVAIVPGHGPVMRDKKYVADVAEVMESVMAQVRAAYRPGATLDEVRGKVNLDALRARIAGGNAFIEASFDSMVGKLAVERAFQELEGRLEPEAMPKG